MSSTKTTSELMMHLSETNVIRLVVAWACVLLTLPVTGSAEIYELDFDAALAGKFLDRWMYPFNITPGTRIQAPTFGAVASEGFDDRDGQFLIGVNTIELGIPTGLSPSSYQIESARLILTEGVGGYRYDSTYDAFQTYLDPSIEIAQADDDPGRPIELYGAGFRNGFEQFSWPDSGIGTAAPVFSAASSFGPEDRGTRNVYAADATGTDVSNNIDSLNGGSNGFDPKPFAIGVGSGSDGAPLEVGRDVSAGAKFTFEIDTLDSGIASYLQSGLSRGELGFVVSSLQATGVQGAGDPFVNLATSNHFAIDGPRFELSVAILDALVGDYDGSGALDVADIDLLVTAIFDGVGDQQFDANGDGTVSAADVKWWVEGLLGTFVGDANLDGEFNSADFVSAFGAGKYEDGVARNATWSTGDWNADLEFDSADFVAAFQSGGYEQGPRAAVNAVPEPNQSAALLLVSWAIPAWLRRSGKSQRQLQPTAR